MKTLEVQLEELRKELYNGLYGLSYDGSRWPAQASIATIEKLIDFKIRVALNDIHNEIYELKKRLQEAGGLPKGISERRQGEW